MREYIDFSDGDGNQRLFLGGDTMGILYCSDVIPLPILKKFKGGKLGKCVSIDHVEGKKLEAATIIRVDADEGGIVFQLAY